jgi:hypothetical protein
MNSQNDNANGEPKNGEPETATASNTPALQASTAVAALTAMLNSVHAAPSSLRSAKPSLLFKARTKGGIWAYGRAQTVVENGSLWAIDPRTLQHGYVALSGNQLLGEKMEPVDQPMPELAKLPQVGVAWQQQLSVDLRCISGVDAGVEVTYKTTSVGGFQAFDDLIVALRDRLSSGLHDNKLSPVVTLGKSDYTHPQFGPQTNPVMKISDWMPLDGPPPTPAPAPMAPASPSSPCSASAANEQPRRRRVASAA